MVFIIQDVVAGGDTSVIQVEDAGYNLGHMDEAKRNEVSGKSMHSAKVPDDEEAKATGKGSARRTERQRGKGGVRGSAKAGSAKAPSASAAQKTIDVWGNVRRAAWAAHP